MVKEKIKPINVKESTWKQLMKIKIDTGNSIDVIIKDLISHVKEKVKNGK